MKPLIVTGIVTILATTLGSAQEKRMTDNPGPEHATLLKLAGEYTSVSKFKRSPNGPAQESRGHPVHAYSGRPLQPGRGHRGSSSINLQGPQVYGYNMPPALRELLGFTPAHGDDDAEWNELRWGQDHSIHWAASKQRTTPRATSRLW